MGEHRENFKLRPIWTIRIKREQNFGVLPNSGVLRFLQGAFSRIRSEGRERKGRISVPLPMIGTSSEEYSVPMLAIELFVKERGDSGWELGDGVSYTTLTPVAASRL